MALTKKTDLALMEVGDYIPCRYTALTSGQLGLFSELGATTATPIPVASSATPDGSFNFIHSGFDTKGRMKLIADRNIQHSIAWDTLNTKGIASGSGVDIGDAGMMVNSFTKLENPATLPTGTGNGVTYSNDGNYMAVALGVSPYLIIYKRVGDTFTKLASPSVLPTGSAYGVAFSNDGNYLSVAHGVTPFVTIYKITSGDIFTKLANPITLPTGQGFGVAFSKDNKYLSIAHNVTPFVTIYKITSGDIFTKLANPSALPTSVGHSIAFSNDGNYLSVGSSLTPFINIYKITTGDIFTKLANPSVLPSGQVNGVTFSNDNNYLSVALSSNPFVTIYKITSGDTFTKLANPSSLASDSSYGVAVSLDGNYLAVSNYASPFIIIYKRDLDVFTKLPNPGTLPTGTGNGVAFSPDNKYLSVAHVTAPFITTYKLDTLDTTSKKTLRLLTGGTSATDLDNEWDKIIVLSTLNGNITAGDNNVWNWTPPYSWVSTCDSTNTRRVLRGNSSGVAFRGATLSSDVSVVYGFRPMLLVELPPPIVLRFLIKYLLNYYTIKTEYYDDVTTHTFIPLTLSGGANPNASDINTFSFNDLVALTNEMTKNNDTFIPIDVLADDFDIKYYME